MYERLNKPIFDVVAWEKETYRKLLYPGGTILRFEYKAPTFHYGRVDDEDTADLEIDADTEIDAE